MASMFKQVFSKTSRRQFLQYLGLGGSAAAFAAAFAACSSRQTPTPSMDTEKKDGYSIFHETMADMTWPEVEQAAKAKAIVLLPIAVIEEHGPHMGLGTDTYLTYYACKTVRSELEKRGIRAIVAPPFYWGINISTGSFPGSFTVRKETMKAVLYDIHASLRKWGFTQVVSLNLHGDQDHGVAILEAIQEIRKELKMEASGICPESALGRFGLTGQEPGLIVQKEPAFAGYRDTHAGAAETGAMLAHFPDQVNLELARTLQPQEGFSPLGYWGAPAKFDVEAARQFDEARYRMTADAIESYVKKAGIPK
jgi:creatinine amidohydrolase